MPLPAPASEAPRPRAGVGPKLSGRLLAALIVTFAVLTIDARYGDGGVLAPLELQTLDWRFHLRGPEAPSGEVVLVLADDAAVAELGAWPPPRAVLAAAVDRLAVAGAASIVLNLLLTEVQPPAAAEVRKLLAASLAGLPQEAQALRARLTAALAESGPDEALAAAIARGPPVLLPYAFVRDARQANVVGMPEWIAASAYRVHLAEPGEPTPGALEPRGLIVPAAALGAVATTVGHVSLLLEVDGSLRTDLPAIAFGDGIFPSLAVEAARLQLGVTREEMVADGRAGIRLGGRLLPLDETGRQLMDPYGPEGSIPTYSLLDLLHGRIDPDRLAHRVVVLGASASGAGDRFTTPFSARLPGSEHLATAIDNILTERGLRRGPQMHALDRLLTALMALAAALLAGRRSPGLSFLALLALLAALACLVQLAFVTGRFWVAALPPTVAVLAAGISVEALRLTDERRRRRRLERQKANLARYFAPAVVERLAASDRPTGLDRTQEAAVMFVDIVGFTRLSHGLPPAQAMALLRTFHTLVERAVFDHGGMVDKFMGDGAMACFGMPDPSPTAAADAIRGALALLDLLAAAEGTRLRVGIGIHQGPVLMGDIGGATQFQFTVVGDTVNLASRLEGATRAHGTPMLVSDRALAAARDHLEPALLRRFEPLGPLEVRGRDERVEAWRLTRAG